MAWLDRALQKLTRASHPRRAMDAASEARDATRSLAKTLGDNEVPFHSVERRIEALVRLEIPESAPQARAQRNMLGEQLLTWASESYQEARSRFRRPGDLR